MLLTSPRLWIIATPLGNPGDLSPRARQILETADLVLAEDTRRAAALFRRLGLTPRRFLSFYEQNEDDRREEVLAALRAGKHVALISDAGTPLLADPGYRLVRACRSEGLAVSPVPGPSAPVAALSAAGLAPLPFTFLGFLPRGAASRRAIFKAYASAPGSLIFFERKNRLAESLALAADILGPRELAICRELTKTHEEFILGRLENSKTLAQDLLGEITVVIGPPEAMKINSDQKDAEALLRALLAQGLKPREAVRQAQGRLPGWSAKQLYALTHNLNKERPEA